MNYIEREFENQKYDYLDIIYGNNFVKTIELKEGDQDGLYTYVDYNFQVRENVLNLTIDVTSSTILIVIEDENDENYITGNFNLTDFDFSLYYAKSDEVDLKIPFYMPTVSYTNLASTIVYDAEEYLNTVPFFDVDSLERFEAYKQDEIITFRHFLDLEFSDKVINKSDIEEAKGQRKIEKQLDGIQTTRIPDKEHVILDYGEVIDNYNSIENKANVIPVLNWVRGENLIDGIEALSDFDCIAIRISSSYGKFLEYAVNEIKIKFSDHLEDFYIIFDMSNNFALEQFEDGIIAAASIFKKVIYLGSPFSAFDISKDRNTETNMNHISYNYPLEIFDFLQNKANKKQFPLLGYGDYCGFDRKTISRSTGGRPSARVVLCSIDTTKMILVRRAWDNMDLKKDSKGNTSIGLIYSMDKLMLDIQNGVLDSDSGSQFLDEVNYDTDEALKDFYPTRPSPATLKTICLRHNYLSIVKNFMPAQKS